MVAKVERVQHVDDIVGAVRVLLAQLVQQPNFDQRLVVEALLVADDLDGDMLADFVVEGAHHLAEAALADDLEDFVAVEDVVVHDLCAG